MTNVVNDELIIKGQKIPIERTELKQSELIFYPDNPRIHSIVCLGGQTPSQLDIEHILKKDEHVRALAKSIRDNGGLIDPVIVRSSTLEVLEGNCRLAAYRLLCDKNPLQWHSIKCMLLPDEVSDSQVFSLLAEYHIKGKKDWSPFEQAGYLYRRNVDHSISVEEVSREVGLTVGEVRNLIQTYDFVLKNDLTYNPASDQNKRIWSFCFEYLKSRDIAHVRSLYGDFDESIIAKIKTNEISESQDIRKLKKIVKVGGNTLKSFANGKRAFGESYDVALDNGADNNAYNRIKKFREWVSHKDVASAISKMDKQLADKAKYELVRLKKRIAYLEKMVS